MSLLDRIAEMFKPAPPRVLSGQWTTQEREEAIRDILALVTSLGRGSIAEELCPHTTPSFSNIYLDDPQILVIEKLITSGSAEEINSRWHEIRRYGINAILPGHEPDVT